MEQDYAAARGTGRKKNLGQGLGRRVPFLQEQAGTPGASFLCTRSPGVLHLWEQHPSERDETKGCVFFFKKKKKIIYFGRLYLFPRSSVIVAVFFFFSFHSPPHLLPFLAAAQLRKETRRGKWRGGGGLMSLRGFPLIPENVSLLGVFLCPPSPPSFLG